MVNNILYNPAKKFILNLFLWVTKKKIGKKVYFVNKQSMCAIFIHIHSGLFIHLFIYILIILSSLQQ